MPLAESVNLIDGAVTMILLGPERIESGLPGKSSWVTGAFQAQGRIAMEREHLLEFLALYGTGMMPLRMGRLWHPPFGQGKHSGPKWGQPGRGRRRKARLAARRRNAR